MDKDQACAVDGSSTLVCENGRWMSARPCRGPKGCKPGDPPECDTSLAKAGDPCITYPRTLGACSADRKSILECTDLENGAPKPKGASRGVFVARSTCPTAVGCEVAGLDGDLTIPLPVCRFAGAKLGDPCGDGNDGRWVCNAEGTALLSCDPQSKKFVLELMCAPKQKCESPKGQSRCL